MQKPLVILTGPTAVGKTSLSIRLAKRINAEIISADSMQVYKHMDIGTAKVTPEEMQGVRHYLIDCLNPDEEFNVTIFQQEALKAMEEIICGASSFPTIHQSFDIEVPKVTTSCLDKRINLKHSNKWDEEAFLRDMGF